MNCRLEEVLNYQNGNVVGRFAEDHNVPLSDAEEIFTETKRWLWLTAKLTHEIETGVREPFKIPLFNEAYAIDLMWHTFLLYTKEYADFCQKYFGFFLHHAPTSMQERAEWKQFMESNPEGAWQQRRDSLEKVYGYIYDELGPAALKKWCEEFPEKFPGLKTD